MAEWTDDELAVIEQIEAFETKQALTNKANSARMQGIANKATAGIDDLMNPPLAPKSPMASNVAAQATAEIPGLMSGQVKPIGAPQEDGWFRARQGPELPSVADYAESAKAGVKAVGNALESASIGAQDPVILKYSQEHGLKYNTAASILRNRGYGS